MKYLVYKHTFPNNKVYIGITSKKNPKERWRNGKGYEHNDIMSKAIQKYGWENVKHEILYIDLDENIAKEKEIELIYQYKSNNVKYGYNISNGGEGANGYKHTLEQIEKAKQNRNLPIYDEKLRKKFSEVHKRTWENEEYRQKMKKIHKNREHRKGYKLSKEAIENIKATRKVKYIRCIETGEIFRGTREASEKTNIDRRTIMRILKREYGYKSAKGLHFEYVGGNIDN